VVVFGLNEPRTLRIMATTVRDGDPSWSGALAGVALGLQSYHILELKDEVPVSVWNEQMAMEELEIEDDVRAAVVNTMRELRGELS
jgi:glycine reductase